MIWQLDLCILTLIVLCGLATISVKDLLSAAVIFGAYSFLMCLLWTEMGAVDVAFTEAAVGAGVSTVLFIAAVFRTSRRVKRRASGRLLMKTVGLTAAVFTGLVLLAAVGDFPDWADPLSPASRHVSPYYITESLSDTSVPNLVTAVLADYRGYDTMFETAVIYVAGLAVIALIRMYRSAAPACSLPPESPACAITDDVYEDTIVRFIARCLTPFIQLFALYVIGHGHHSPGGGFQGGVILGASFILLALSFDLGTAQHRMSEKANILLGNLGIFLYAGIGLLCVVLGASFLDYSILHRLLPATGPVAARSHGILGVEIGVAVAVMAIVVSIYVNIASCGRQDKGL